MSIEKDVENMYKSDIEKRKKNQKKKKKKKFIALLLIIAFVAAIILLLNYLGLGFGGGKGEGGDSSANSTSGVSSEAETTTTTETSAEPKEFIGIKVSGSTYIYQGSEITIENFRETIRLMNDNVVVMITDDNATQNAMDALTAVFEADGREYAIEIPGNPEQGDLSSSEAENIVP